MSTADPLPSLDRLEALDASTLARLRDRLKQIGLGPAELEPIVRAAGTVHPLVRRPVLHYHARRVKGALGLAARALMFGDPIDGSELEVAFGDLALPLRESGLLAPRAQGFVSPFCFTLVDDFFVVSDDLSQGGQAVMGLAPTTVALTAAAFPRKQVGRSLDLGCGAGAVALVLSKRSGVVVATDINQRALALARFNTRLNGVGNIDVREGSLFEPVSKERFDLIASQPPFVPQSSRGKASEFMAGGERGDALPLAVLTTAPDHLVPGGRAVLFIEWGHGPKEKPPGARILETLAGAPVDLLVFQLPAGAVDEHAVEYAAALHPDLGSSFDSEAQDRRDHLSKMGFESMVPTLVVMRRVDDRKPRADVWSTASFAHAPPNAKRIDRLLAAREVTASMDRVMGAKLSLVEGTRIREEQLGLGADKSSTLVAVLPPAAMSEPIPLTPQLMQLAHAIQESATVRAGINTFLVEYGSDQSADKLAVMVAKALLSGLLECVEAEPGASGS
jgi:methylase of polypeptide subunit release factors